jgi:hypothetical protein
MARAFGEQVLAVVDQQPDLTLWAGKPRGRQTGLADRRASDRDSVDRVAFPERPRRFANLGHQLRRHPHHRLAGQQQEPFQRRENVRQSSSAHNRSDSSERAQSSSCACPAGRAGTVSTSSSSAVCAFTAPAVCVWLCASTPTTIIVSLHFSCG